MTLVAVLGLLISYGVSVQAAVISWRDPRGGARAHALVTATGAFTFGSAFLAWFLYLDGEMATATTFEARHLLLIAALVMVIAGLTFWVLAWLRRHKTADEDVPGRRKSPLMDRIKFNLQLGSANWQQLEIPAYAKEDHRDLSRFGRLMLIAAGAVTIPSVLALLATTILMNIRGSSASDFAAHTVGYYTLLTATSWTVIFLATLLLVALHQVAVGRTRGSLSISDVVISVGTWAGFGAAGGVFVGALIPIVVILIPSGPFQQLDVTLLDTITPDLLLSTSAAGAVLGFLLGEVISLVSFATAEQNLFMRVAAPPVLFGFLASVLGPMGLRPGAMSKRLAELYTQQTKHGASGGSDPFAVARNVDLDSSEGWSQLIEAFDKAGWNQMVDSYFYYVFTWVTVILVVLFSYSLAVHQRELKLAAADKSLK